MPQGMPTRYLDSNVCAVCGNPLLVAAGEEGVIGLCKVFYYFRVI